MIVKIGVSILASVLMFGVFWVLEKIMEVGDERKLKFPYGEDG